MNTAPVAPAESIAALFRTLKNTGFVLCLVGALAMIAGRYMPGAPRWLMYIGVSVIVFGWGVFAYALVQRAAYLRARAPRGEHPGLKS
jgi:hypothetical protein